ncbi:hypothetical protein LJB83_02645 [Clostridia bacterium OttesenSCG-928-F22]|nr:hypothetical protein [Clostridia bacterium OttesenSCG-928-F22]
MQRSCGMTPRKNRTNNTTYNNRRNGNYTMQEWGNEVPFSDEQLLNASGTEMPVAVAQDIAQMPGMPDASMPETLTNPIFTPGYLRTQIGQWMRVEFLVGSTLTDRVGQLLQVGASYIVLQSLESSSKILCDIYSIKFVTIVSEPAITSFY